MRPKCATAATKNLTPPGKIPNGKCRVPGHSNKKRQPTERNLRWTHRRHIEDTIQQPDELVQKPKTQTVNRAK